MSLILNGGVLYEQWKDIQTMAGRIAAIRRELHRLLTGELKTPGNWNRSLNEVGMFLQVPRYVRGR
jgi:aspartate aminotransferase, cytoplasmic